MKVGTHSFPTFIFITAYKLIPSIAIRLGGHPPEDILTPVPFRRMASPSCASHEKVILGFGLRFKVNLIATLTPSR
jgi:hypothetical protein